MTFSHTPTIFVCARSNCIQKKRTGCEPSVRIGHRRWNCGPGQNQADCAAFRHCRYPVAKKQKSRSLAGCGAVFESGFISRDLIGRNTSVERDGCACTAYVRCYRVKRLSVCMDQLRYKSSRPNNLSSTPPSLQPCQTPSPTSNRPPPSSPGGTTSLTGQSRAPTTPQWRPLLPPSLRVDIEPQTINIGLFTGTNEPE